MNILKKIQQLIQVCKVNKTNNHSTQINFFNQSLELLNFNFFGFNSWKKEPKNTLILSSSGDIDQAFCLMIAGKKQDINEGEVCIYDDFDNKIYLKNGKILIEGKVEFSNDVKILGKLNIEQNVFCNGDIQDKNTSIKKLKDNLNNHIHTGNKGVPTSSSIKKLV